MEHPVIDSSVQLIEELFSSKVGTPEFSMTVGICALVWVLVTRVLLGMFSSKRGILASGLALVVPLSIGLIAHGMAGLHLVPLVEIDWAAKWLPIAALVLFILLAVLVIAKRILQVSASVAVFIYLVATAAAVGGYFGAQITLGVIQFGEEKVEQREEKVQGEIDSLL